MIFASFQLYGSFCKALSLWNVSLSLFVSRFRNFRPVSFWSLFLRSWRVKTVPDARDAAFSWKRREKHVLRESLLFDQVKFCFLFSWNITVFDLVFFQAEPELCRKTSDRRRTSHHSSRQRSWYSSTAGHRRRGTSDISHWLRAWDFFRRREVRLYSTVRYWI